MRGTSLTIREIIWKRFSTITSIIGDVNSSIIAILFYFTILLPFGLGYTFLADPLRRKSPKSIWLEREPVPNDIPSARQQG